MGLTIDGDVYTLDPAGNRSTKQDDLAGVTTSYGYDNLYELLSATQGGTTTESYSYDPVGNRTASLAIPSYTVNTSNELTSDSNASYTYDSNGNTLTKTDSTGTTTYAWDFENRLTSVTLPGTAGTVSFKYDPFGRRIEKTSPTATSVFVYDGVSPVESTNSSGSEVASYTQGQSIDEPLAMLRGTTSDYYEQDGLGSVTSLSSSSGSIAQTYTYDSFGNTTNSSGSLTNFFRYTGREFDTETGLYFNRARYYDPTSGRFLREDPIGFEGGNNFYKYTGNNPILYGDPFGLYTEVDAWMPVGHGESSFGHTSIDINGTSYSWGPEGLDIESEDAYVARNSFRDGEGFVLSLTTDQENALVAYFMDLKQHPKKYNMFWRNCSSTIYDALTAVGVNLNGQWVNWLQTDPISGMPIPVELPQDLVFQLEDTPGLVTGTTSHPKAP